MFCIRAVENQLGPWCDLQDRGPMGGLGAKSPKMFHDHAFQTPGNEGNALFKNVYMTLSRQIDGHRVSHKSPLYRDFATIIYFHCPIFFTGPFGARALCLLPLFYLLNLKRMQLKGNIFPTFYL